MVLLPLLPLVDRQIFALFNCPPPALIDDVSPLLDYAFRLSRRMSTAHRLLWSSHECLVATTASRLLSVLNVTVPFCGFVPSSS